MSKHNGINATRDVLKDQLALAADEIIRQRGLLQARLNPADKVPSLGAVMLVQLALFSSGWAMLELFA